MVQVSAIQVWIMIILSIVVSGLLMKALTYSLKTADEIQYSLWSSFWVFFSVFVQQGSFSFLQESRLIRVFRVGAAAEVLDVQDSAGSLVAGSVDSGRHVHWQHGRLVHCRQSGAAGDQQRRCGQEGCRRTLYVDPQFKDYHQNQFHQGTSLEQPVTVANLLKWVLYATYRCTI